MKTENIQRIMSSFLRMVGGRLKWLNDTLHLVDEHDVNYVDIAAREALFNKLSLLNNDRSKSISITADPAASYEILLPANSPITGDILHAIDNVGTTAWLPATSIGANLHTVDEFNPTNGQTSFILSFTPKDPLNINLFVNGIRYNQTTDFNVSGQMITWLNTSFTLSLGDVVSIEYPNL